MIIKKSFTSKNERFLKRDLKSNIIIRMDNDVDHVRFASTQTATSNINLKYG